jgi:hypothetical protein
MKSRQRKRRRYLVIQWQFSEGYVGDAVLDWDRSLFSDNHFNSSLMLPVAIAIEVSAAP